MLVFLFLFSQCPSFVNWGEMDLIGGLYSGQGTGWMVAFRA